MIVCSLLRILIWILILLTERFLIRIVSTTLALLEGKYVTLAFDNMAPLSAIEKDIRQHMDVQEKRRLWLWAYSFTPTTLWTPSWFRCWAVSTPFIFFGKKQKLSSASSLQQNGRQVFVASAQLFKQLVEER